MNAHPDCEVGNEHINGLAALYVMVLHTDGTETPRVIQRCDWCLGLGVDWSDEDAVEAVNGQNA